MIMKTNLYIALLSIALLFTGCDDDLNFGNTLAIEKHVGDEIDFGTSASYGLSDKQNPTTRTVYGGYQEGATEEPVFWVNGDDVRIYCEQARFQMSDYNVNVSENEDSVVTTSLTRKGEYSLQWGEDPTHEFYAVYPAPNATETGKNLNGCKTIDGVIPATQTASSYVYDKDNYKHVFAPDMRYAYMVARTNIPDKDKIGENVYLQFRPIATAVEITLVNNSGRNLTFNEITLSSAKTIAGTFTANLEDWTMPSTGNMRYATGYPKITGSGTSTTITIPTKNGENGIDVLLGESVTFTAFMLPTVDVTDLVIAINAKLGETDGYKTGTLNGVEIKMNKKTYLRGLSLSGISYKQSEWIKAIVENSPNTKLNALSIPGAGGATSGNMAQDETTAKYRQQNLSIEQLWDKGIRCFEFAVDVAGTTVTNNEDLGKEFVICNGNSTGITLNDAFSQVTAQLKEHPQEFAMVILAYQTLGGFNKRAPAEFMSDFNTFWTNFKSNDVNKGAYTTEAYSSNKTVKEVQGKLFCVVRPTSIYQDYNDGKGEGIITSDYTDTWWGGTSEQLQIGDVQYSSLNVTTEHTDIIVVKGWGALKDKWQQRGYSTHSIRQKNIPTVGGIKTYNSDGNPGRPFDTSTMTTYERGDYTTAFSWHNGTWYGKFAAVDYKATVEADFTYETTTEGLSIYAQEWARVSNLSFTSNEEIPQLDMNEGKTECIAIVWNSTYQEKCDNITSTLTKALANTSNTIYINSLCGYFIDMSIPESYKPCTLTDWNIKAESIFSSWKRYPLSGSSQTSGMYGNIETYAKMINDYFNKHLQSVTTANSQLGSMGIILLDRVGEYESSERIPQIIIANNFQFKLSETPAYLNVKTSDNLNKDDILAAPAQRGVKGADEGVSIVWE